MKSLKDFLKNSVNVDLSKAQQVVRLDYTGNVYNGSIVLCKDRLLPCRGVVIRFHDGTPYVSEQFGEKQWATIINFCNTVNRKRYYQEIDKEINKVLNGSTSRDRLEELLMFCYLMMAYYEAKINE